MAGLVVEKKIVAIGWYGALMAWCPRNPNVYIDVKSRPIIDPIKICCCTALLRTLRDILKTWT